MYTRRISVAVLVMSLACLSFAQDKKPATPLDQLKALAGTWSKPAEGDKPASEIQFRVIANGTAVHETMFPGTTHEMVNVYHMDGDKLMVTHYCAQGVQPRMKLVSAEDGKLKFEFFDSTNLKSRDDPHMDSVTLTIAGDRLTETWAYYENGKVTQQMEFSFTKKS